MKKVNKFDKRMDKILSESVRKISLKEAEGSISMKFTKTQWEIIAYMLALGESDIRNSEIKKAAHGVLGTLQQKRIFGDVDID